MTLADAAASASVICLSEQEISICGEGGNLPRLNFRRRESLSGHRLTATQACAASFRRSTHSREVFKHFVPLRITKTAPSWARFSMCGEGGSRTLEALT